MAVPPHSIPCVSFLSYTIFSHKSTPGPYSENEGTGRGALQLSARVPRPVPVILIEHRQLFSCPGF